MLGALAYGDALGARYEGLHLRLRPDWVRFGRGVLIWRTPGWWTDDTDMALGILLALADLLGLDYPGAPVATAKRPTAELAGDAGLRAVVDNWLSWRARGSLLDAGTGTVRVLHAVKALPDRSPSAVLAVSRRQLGRPHRGGGNGAVMRTAPVALAFLGDPAGAAKAAAAIAELTHPAARATQAAALWTVLCERAVTTGALDLVAALEHVADSPFWADLLGSAARPGRNGRPGWTPTTVADAWWCVQRALEAGTCGALERGVRLAVASGVDPDTTAAVAGALLGALEGTGPLPEAARKLVHGGDWTGRRWSISELASLAGDCVSGPRRPAVSRLWSNVHPVPLIWDSERAPL